MNKEYIVFSLKLAGYLMMNGFVLKRVEKSNRENSTLNVYIFNDSENIRSVSDRYKKMKLNNIKTTEVSI